MFNYNQSINAFEQFLKQYDMENKRMNLKKVHTFGVIDCSTYIASDLGLSDDDIELAKLIALLHDIGRFEQLKRYDSFDDASTIDHALLAVELLKENNLIRNFITDDSYDEIIFTAILNHNTYLIADDIIDEQALLQTKIIRDADKTDNFRVKTEETFETLFGITEDELGSEALTEKIYQDFMHHKLILSSDRITHLDMWVSYIAFIFDFNFPAGLRYIKAHRFLDKLSARIMFSNEDSAIKVAELFKEAALYIKAKIIIEN